MSKKAIRLPEAWEILANDAYKILFLLYRSRNIIHRGSFFIKSGSFTDASKMIKKFVGIPKKSSSLTKTLTQSSTKVYEGMSKNRKIQLQNFSYPCLTTNSYFCEKALQLEKHKLF